MMLDFLRDSRHERFAYMWFVVSVIHQNSNERYDSKRNAESHFLLISVMGLGLNMYFVFLVRWCKMEAPKR